MFQNNADALQHLDVDVVFLEDAVHVFARSGDTSCEGSHRYPPVLDLLLYFSSNVDHVLKMLYHNPRTLLPDGFGFNSIRSLRTFRINKYS